MLQHAEPSRLAVQPRSRGAIPTPRARYRARLAANANPPYRKDLSYAVDAVLSRIDLNLVKIAAIRAAIEIVLINAPASETKSGRCTAVGRTLAEVFATVEPVLR